METRENHKELIQDVDIVSDVIEGNLSRRRFVRVYAVKRTFRNVIFAQSIFDRSYFRNCVFVDCDFTGCVFRDSYLVGSSYRGCEFRYTTWHNTSVDDSILTDGLPTGENLARDMVQSLRANFQALGNHEAVNKAVAIEIDLTGKHYRNAAYPVTSYYRKKYAGRRLEFRVKHFVWRMLDCVWGNGESIWRVFCTSALVVLIGALFLMFVGDSSPLSALTKSASIFLDAGNNYNDEPVAYLLLMALGRYICLGLLLAVMIRRLSRR